MGAFTATNLGSPPPSPPDVSGQQGGNPMEGIAGALANKSKQGPPGDMSDVSSVHPQGAILALLETIKKATNQLSRMDEGMAPFVNRALAILEQGVGQVISKKPGASPEGGGGKPEGESAKPPQGETNKGFPG